MIDGEIVDRGIGKAVRRREGLELAALIARETVRRADPQNAAGGGGQCSDGISGQVAITFVEKSKLVAVEARQSFIGAEPEVAVAGLRYGADGVLRKAVFF